MVTYPSGLTRTKSNISCDSASSNLSENERKEKLMACYGNRIPFLSFAF